MFSLIKNLYIVGGAQKVFTLFSITFSSNLIPLNRAFWETMHLMNKAQHSHRLNPFKINEIGLLDPKNFPPDFSA